MADETTDVSTTEQINEQPIVFGYVDYETNNPRVSIILEDFMDFFPVCPLSGRALADKLKTYVSNTLGQGPCMVGQAYDGTAAVTMSGREWRTLAMRDSRSVLQDIPSHTVS